MARMAGVRAVGSMSVVGALSPALQFVVDSQDVAPIKTDLGAVADGYDAFFVGIENGDYTEVWGICGIIPYSSKLTTRLL